MTPVRYSIKWDSTAKLNGTTYFHYKFSDLRKFVYYALNQGNAGQLLVARRGSILLYKCSGTIENPQKVPLKSIRGLLTLSMQHNEIFDGKLKTDDQYLIPPNYDFLENSRMIFLDMSEYDNKPNINDTRSNR
jgi:hypothetical protein